jgi:hypothetical protein
MKSAARWRFADFQHGTHRFSVLAREEGVARELRADHARQPERSLELGGRGGNVRQGQRGVSGEPTGMLLANRGEPIVDGPAEGHGHVQRLGLDPTERTEAVTTRSSRRPGGPSDRDESRRHRRPWPAALRPSAGPSRPRCRPDSARCAASLVRARRASASSAGLQWACMSIMTASFMGCRAV